MQLNGTYILPQFDFEITNPNMEVMCKNFCYDNNQLEVHFIISITGSSLGVYLIGTDASGGTYTLLQTENWVANEMQQYLQP